MFSFLYGYSVYMYSGDILDYNDSYMVIRTYTWSDFIAIITNRYSTIPYNLEYNVTLAQPDYYAIILEFLVTRFTDNPRWFFALVSVIYTWIFLEFIGFITKLLKINDLKQVNVFYIFVLFCIPFYVGVTGVRFWPALFIFCLFIVKFLIFKRRRFLLFSCISILFHFSFLIPVILFVPFLFLRNRIKSLYILLIFSGFIFVGSAYSTKLSLIKDNFIGINEKIDEKTDSYINEDHLEERSQNISQTNWYIRLYTNALNYALMLLIVLIEFRVIKVRQNVISKRLQSYVLFSLIISLLIYDLGSIARFVRVFQLVALIYLASLYVNNKRQLMFPSYAFYFLLIFHVTVSFRAGFYTVDPYLLTLGSLITVFILRSDMSLSELLIGH